MKPSPVLDKIAARLSDRKAVIDAEFAPLVRNHLVQLFRAAHAKDNCLTGMSVGMGVASGCGLYAVVYDDGETGEYRATSWHPHNCAGAKHQEVTAWLAEVANYSDRICTGQSDALPYVNDITLADLTTERVKRAKVWNRK